METEKIKQINFKTDKVERYFSLGIMAIFIISFNDMKSWFWTIFLFALTAVVFAYYFKWYKNKPAYILIGDNQITVNPPLFFKPQVIKNNEIKQMKLSEKSIEVVYNSSGIAKTVKIYSILMQEDHWEQIRTILKELEQSK